MFKIALPLQEQRRLVHQWDAMEAGITITRSQDAQQLKKLLWQWKCHRGRFAASKATMGDKTARYTCTIVLADLSEAEVTMLDHLAKLRVRSRFIAACVKLGLGLYTQEQFLKEVE